MSAAAPSWIGVEQRHLAAYAAVARNRSFRAAAEELGYSQPAVSQLVRKLEDLVGMALVVRRSGSGRVRLTPAGTLMLHHAARLLDGFAAARADLAVLGGRPSRIGVLASLATRLLPPMLRSARAFDDIEVLELPDDLALSRALARGDLDIAIGGMPHGAERLHIRRVGIDPYILAVPTGSSLAHFDGRPPSELLERQPLIACGTTNADETRRIDRELRVRGVVPCWSSRASSVSAALGAVRAGTGAAIVPASAVEPWDSALLRLSLDGLVSPRCICRYAHRDRRLPDDVHEVVAAGVAALEQASLVA